MKTSKFAFEIIWPLGHVKLTLLYQSLFKSVHSFANLTCQHKYLKLIKNLLLSKKIVVVRIPESWNVQFLLNFLLPCSILSNVAWPKVEFSACYTETHSMPSKNLPFRSKIIILGTLHSIQLCPKSKHCLWSKPIILWFL